MINIKSCLRTTRQNAADHWWFADHKLRTAGPVGSLYRSDACWKTYWEHLSLFL